MKKSFNAAMAEKSLGFFSLNIKKPEINWDEKTGERLGVHAKEEARNIVQLLSWELRSYILKELSRGSNERFRLIVPLRGEIMEMVVLPQDCAADDTREGFFFPYPLHEPLELMKKYFLSNISNTLRSLLNSVVIAKDILTMSGKDTIAEHQKFLSLMAQDAIEVNVLLNRMGEIINYSPSGSIARVDTMESYPLIQAVHANLQYLAEDASISLTMAVPESVPSIRVNFTLFILTLFLAVRYALSNTEPLGEIIITAREKKGWVVEIWLSGTDIPPNLAIYPEKHDLQSVAMGSWSESSELQLIDSLLRSRGQGLTLLSNRKGLSVMLLPLPH